MISPDRDVGDATPAGGVTELVSVIMPVFNAAVTLRRSIDSILTQSHATLELILVDDGSTDGSRGLIEDYAYADSRVRAFLQPANAGVAAARNVGLDNASGSHIAFCDSDDWWHPRKLEWQLGQMRSDGARVSYTAYQRLSEDGRLLSTVLPPASISYTDMLESNHIGNLTGMYDRRLGDVPFQKIGHEDYVFWLDRVRRAGGARCARHGEPLAYYLVRSGSVSANKLRAMRWQWRIYRDTQDLSIFLSLRYMVHYAWNALRKRK
jgi:glycosyltransferase involved in cell wall biosynthesis